MNPAGGRMSKVKVQIAKMGNINAWIDLGKVRRWKSQLFEILPDINQHRLPTRAAGIQWDFTDEQVSRAIPKKIVGDFLIVLTDCALESNYYMRRLLGNRVCITFFQVKDILARENIPLENYVLRSIYEALIYFTLAQNHGGQLPQSEESYTHDETKGCLFDMTGNKADLSVSCRAPTLCDTCYSDLSRSSVPTNFLDKIKKELKRIRIPAYYRLQSIVKRHPILSILITALAALLINILSDIVVWLIK
jgi:hypothetical protein